MEFFIPGIKEKTEDFYINTIVKFIESQGHKVFLNKRVYSITFKHKNKLITETVGNLSPTNNEPIFAILETENILLTCTKYRGVLKGEPMITGKHDIESIVYFESIEKNIYKYGDWIYKLDSSKNHKVESPKKLPVSLFKYYNNNFDNQDAIINKYLFCSHPFHLNDSMDCSNLLWDFSNITRKIYNGFFEQLGGNLLGDKKNDFELDKKNDFEFLKNTFWSIVTDRSGIISLSENPLHTLMWSHYASEKGFMVEFDRTQLIEEFKINNPSMLNYVLMPIQYVDKLEQIDFFSNDFNTPDIPYLYSLNIKKSDWIYENEWRLICYSESYGVPNSILLPVKDIKGRNERRFYYSIDSIKSFTLGKYFFNGKNLSKYEYPDIYYIKNKSDMKFINYIYNNFNDRLFLSNELEEDKKFERIRHKVKLVKLGENKFQLLKI